ARPARHEPAARNAVTTPPHSGSTRENIMHTGFTRTLAAALVAAGIGGATPALALDKVIYGTASRVSLANTVMYAAEVMGLFEEEGIEVETIQFEGSGVLYPQLASNTITVGYPIPDILIISHDEGKDPLPVKFFYNVTRKYNWEIIVPADSEIQTIEDLKGKSIGVGGLSWGNVPVTRAILKEVGIDPETEVEIIPVGQGASAVEAFTSGQIDALNQFDVVHSLMEASGIEIRRLELPEKYLKLSGNSFAANEKLIEENPDLLVRFARAYTKGLVVCEANPEGCIRLFWQLHPDAKPTGDEEANMREAVTVMLNNLATKMPEGPLEERRFGEFEKEGWETNVQVLFDVGTITNTDITVDNLYTNELVEQFGDFDR